MKIKITLSFFVLLSLLIGYFCQAQTYETLPDDYQTTRIEEYQTIRPEVENTGDTNIQIINYAESKLDQDKDTLDLEKLEISDLKEVFKDTPEIGIFGEKINVESVSNILGSNFGGGSLIFLEDKKALFRVEKKIDAPEYKKLAKIVTNIKQPEEIFDNMGNFWLNSLLAFLYLIIFFYCTHLFNESRGIVAPDWSSSKKINSILKFFSSKINKFKLIQKNKILRILSILFSFLVLGIILSFIDPTYNIFSIDSVFFAGFIIISVILGAMAKDLIYYITVKIQKKENVSIKIVPAGYVISVLSVVVNRLAGLLPSTVFGSIFTVKYKNIDSEQIENGKTYSKAVWITIVLSLVLWFVSIFLNGTFYLAIIGIAYGMLNDIFWSLTLSDMFWGKKIFKFNKLLWFGTYFIVVLLFFYLMINPDGDFDQVRNSFDNNFWKMVYILIWIMGTTLLFSVYAKYIHPKIYKKI